MSLHIFGKKEPAVPKAADPATVGMLAAAYAELQQQNAALAVVLREAMQKIARLEDNAGLTDESVKGQPNPVGAPCSGVAQSAMRDLGMMEPIAYEPTFPRNSIGGDVEDL